jgi:purine-cytosine permease-like protein
MQAADLRPVSAADRTQSAFDLFLIFAGANIVATTLQVGASLGDELSISQTMAVVGVGSLFGAWLVAALAPAGSRLGVPSIVAARAVLGNRGAAVVAVLLYVTNFAWIALNNVIAASVAARALPGLMDARVWSALLGVLATAVVAGGPRAVGRADRIAVPLMLVAGGLMTWACLRLPWPAASASAAATSGDLMRAFDVVVGYQASWLLMFADYPRYTADARRGAVAVFAGLALAALWFMPIGTVTARLAGSAEPGAMIDATGLGMWGAVLVALATLTTNFVNIYMSALAWKSLRPSTGDRSAIWSIGLIGTALGLLGGVWLDRFADFVLVLGGALVPIGAILFAQFVLIARYPDVETLYRNPGPYTRHWGVMPAGMLAWVAGAATYYAATDIGATLPTLVVTTVVYLVVHHLVGSGLIASHSARPDPTDRR